MYETLKQALDAERKARVDAKALVDAAKAEERDLTADEAKQAQALLDKADEAKAAGGELQAQEEQAERFAKRMADNAKALDAVPAPKTRQKFDATPRNRAAEEIAHVEAFGKYLSGERLGDKEADLMKPTGQYWSANAQKGAVVPRSVARAILGMPVAAIPHLSTDADGGANLFDREYIAQLLQLAPEPERILGRVTVIPTSTGDIRFPRLVQTDDNEFGGASFSWINEAAAKPETELTFDQVPIATHELAGYTEVSHTLMRRSVFDIIGLIGTIFRKGMQATIEWAILNGSGTAQPLGVVNTAGIRRVARQTAGTTTSEDLINVEHEVMPEHRPPCVWTIHDLILRDLKVQTDLLGRPLFMASMAGGTYDRLIGYPYIPTVRQPYNDDGDVLFLDWSQYMLAVEQEIVVRTSEHFRFRNNVEALSIFACVGGRLVQPRAAVMLADSAS